MAIVIAICAGLGGICMVASIGLPLAAEGIGSAISLHELFDLLLSGRLDLGIPRWVGLFGYLPALGGVLVMIAEASSGRTKALLRFAGLVIGALSLGALVVGGLDGEFGRVGSGLIVGMVGLSLAAGSAIADTIMSTKATGGNAGQLP